MKKSPGNVKMDFWCYKCFGIMPITTLLRSRSLSWLQHVSCSEGWFNQYLILDVVGIHNKGQSRNTWDDVIQDNINYEISSKTILQIGLFREMRRKLLPKHPNLVSGKEEVTPDRLKSEKLR